jgi:hypothetical protein
MKIRPLGAEVPCGGTDIHTYIHTYRQTDRQRNMTKQIVSFRILQTPLEIGEKDLEEVASHDAIFPKKPISKKKLPRIHIYTEVFHCSSA